MAVSNFSGGNPPKGKAKAAHVNMMTDTVIANLPPDALRSVLRGLLGFEQNLTSHFHDLTAKYLQATKSASPLSGFFSRSPSGLVPTDLFFRTQGRIRCLMGCGFGFDSIRTLTDVVQELLSVFRKEDPIDEGLSNTLAAIDGDIVQAVTAVQKELLTGSGSRPMTISEQDIIKRLRDIQNSWVILHEDIDLKFAFARGVTRLAEFEARESIAPQKTQITTLSIRTKNHITETVQLGSLEVPRIFAGLWQFSSPAWGTASRTKINTDFRKHVDTGFTAYGKYTFLF